MATIGEKWRRAQVQSGIGKSRDDAATKKAEQKKEADEIIRNLPRMIEEAIKNGSGEVEVMKSWLRSDDVAGTDPEKVDKLADLLHKEKRPLRASDLAGSAAIVFAWCDANGLECYLKSEKIPMYDFEYRFCVRPKQS